jgi:hypothetical protein
MKRPIDIVDIKQAVKQGEITAYVKDGKIYIKNEIGECVQIGEADDRHEEKVY